MQPQRQTAVLEPITLPADTDPGSHDRFAHYVRKDQLGAALVDETPVVALCGKMWVPMHDPTRYPVCPECKQIRDQTQPPEDTGPPDQGE